MADLYPVLLNKDDLRAAIEWVVQRMAQHGLTVTLTDDGQDKPLSEEWLSTLFQGVRELLFNVLKHSGTHRATVSLDRAASTVRVTVSDEGRGFAGNWRDFAPSAEGRFGLFNLRERVDLMGGSLTIESGPSAGTRATLIAPVFVEL